ncbi:MAG: MTH1187 family thiamine-binding protein [Nitrospirota bacterium]
MNILAEFSIVPVGTGSSISSEIAHVMKIVSESGVRYKANPMGTVLEGTWDEVMGVIKKCHEAVMANADRVITRISIDDRKSKEQRMEKKIESVEQKLGKKLEK